jgi:D-alanyl-lipoteichoic acid acyltransferase DltB (MBOAT superfamily)
LYVPLGGARSRLWNTFVIFTFVAIWHDIELKLLAWGWLITFFIVPELLCTRYFCTIAMRDQLGDWHIHLCALGGVLNVFLMMTANLVGFAVGVDGMIALAKQLLQPSGFLFILFFSGWLFATVHVMFAHESSRKRSRLKSKYP